MKFWLKDEKIGINTPFYVYFYRKRAKGIKSYLYSTFPNSLIITGVHIA